MAQGAREFGLTEYVYNGEGGQREVSLNGRGWDCRGDRGGFVEWPSFFILF